MKHEPWRVEQRALDLFQHYKGKNIKRNEIKVAESAVSTSSLQKNHIGNMEEWVVVFY